MTVETCPHYLAFSAEEIPDGDTRFKCAPPIRDAANKEKLWEHARNNNKYNDKDQCLITSQDDDFSDDDWDTN